MNTVYHGSEAEERLIVEYGKLVRRCARSYFLAGGDSEDLIQEGMLGLLSAVRTFDPSRNAKFETYAEYCIRRRVISAVRSASRFKHSPLNNYVSLESPGFDETDTLNAYYLRDPEEFVIARERVGEITEMLYGSLSKFESAALALYLNGSSCEEMSVILGKTHKSVDNAVQRIRRKLTQLLNNGGNQ
ncbi:MAG: sigma-70 family RNA polymerase sigma factor [Oscillospiraceae bacterium]|jgi:RNA polymerase sporulation-specific sigma factor|nr:sigma-70 family RNA polymerase sigma factor [Oscillospiraceae bacterium]